MLWFNHFVTRLDEKMGVYWKWTRKTAFAKKVFKKQGVLLAVEDSHLKESTKEVIFRSINVGLVKK